MYCIVQRCREGSGVKPLFFLCVKLFVIISIRQKSGYLWAWELVIGFADVILFCPWPIIPLSLKTCASKMVICEWTDHFFKRKKGILLTALFERAHSSQNALVSWLRTHKVRHQVKISACVNVHASIYCTSNNRFCSTGSFLLKILFAFIFVHFKCTPPPPPFTSRYNWI